MALNMKKALANKGAGLPTGPASAVALERAGQNTRTVTRYVALDDIRKNPENDYRETDLDSGIAVLAGGIYQKGLIHNIVLSHREDGSYLLLSGERRFRAYRLLQADPVRNANHQFDAIQANIYSDLNHLDEMLILDEANLLNRGGAGAGEARTRKCVLRYLGNLQKRYHITETEAKAVAAEVTGISARTIARDIRLNGALLPELLSLLDAGQIGKDRVSAALTRYTEEEQQEILKMFNGILPLLNGPQGGEFQPVFSALQEQLIATSAEENIVRRAEQLRVHHMALQKKLKRLASENPELHSDALKKAAVAYHTRLAKMSTQLKAVCRPTAVRQIQGIAAAGGDIAEITALVQNMQEQLSRLSDALRQAEP